MDDVARRDDKGLLLFRDNASGLLTLSTYITIHCGSVLLLFSPRQRRDALSRFRAFHFRRECGVLEWVTVLMCVCVCINAMIGCARCICYSADYVDDADVLTVVK